MRIGYVVSRFPHVTETFILRELVAVDAEPGVSVELLSLFPARSQTVHDAARPWAGRLHRPGHAAALRAALAWTARRPVAVARILGAVVADHVREPRRLARALATVPLAMAHARTAQRLRLDHVHAHFATYPALTAWVIRRLTGIPYSVAPHAHDIFVSHAGLRRRFAQASFVTAISQYNRGYLAALSPAGTRLPIVRYGVDLDRPGFAERSLPREGPVAAVCVSSFAAYKGQEVLLEALRLGGAGTDRLQLTFVGDGPLRPHVERLAARYGLEGRVRFLGSRPEDEVAALLGASDLLVQPSVVARDGDTEGLPNTLIEALAAGVPAVATTVAGVPELIREGETGRLAEPGDAAGLRDAIERLLADPAATAAQARAGRRAVERDHAIDASAAALLRELGHGA